MTASPEPTTARPGGRANAGSVPISACIITYQEADRIVACLESVAFCAEVIVVDSGSTDATTELCAEHGARVVERTPFPGHIEQKRFAVEQARHDWVLCIDADERVSPELSAEILRLAEGGMAARAYEMPRRNHYLGRIVRRGLFWPDRKLRLFDRRFGIWGGTNPHDKVVERTEGAFGPTGIVRLQGPLDHDSYRSFSDHLRTIDSFTAIAAKALRAQGRRSRIVDLLVRPPAVVIKSLVLKRGFLDGWRGFVIAGMAGYYDWLKYWRLRREWRR